MISLAATPWKLTANFALAGSDFRRDQTVCYSETPCTCSCSQGLKCGSLKSKALPKNNLAAVARARSAGPTRSNVAPYFSERMRLRAGRHTLKRQ